MSEAKPYPKDAQLAHHRKRYRRVVASRIGWERLRDEKGGPCRVCGEPAPSVMELHHLVSRTHGGGDVPDNLVPLCTPCHVKVTVRYSDAAARALLLNLSDDEYAHMIERGGEDYPERAYGIRYER